MQYKIILVVSEIFDLKKIKKIRFKSKKSDLNNKNPQPCHEGRQIGLLPHKNVGKGELTTPHYAVHKRSSSNNRVKVAIRYTHSHLRYKKSKVAAIISCNLCNFDLIPYSYRFPWTWMFVETKHWGFKNTMDCFLAWWRDLSGKTVSRLHNHET